MLRPCCFDTKFQDHTEPLVQEKILNVFNFALYSAWRPSWSCDQDNFYQFLPFLRRLHIKMALIGRVVSKEVHIYTSTPRAGSDNRYGQILS